MLSWLRWNAFAETKSELQVSACDSQNTLSLFGQYIAFGQFRLRSLTESHIFWLWAAQKSRDKSMLAQRLLVITLNS